MSVSEPQSTLSTQRGLSIEAQTGWKRPYPLMICQDVTVLYRVFEYSYDLRDVGFLDYCRRRIGSDPRKAECGLERYIELDSMSDDEYRAETEFSMYGYRYTAHERDSLVRTRRISKGAYQDAWELYCELQREMRANASLSRFTEREQGELF